MKKFLFVTSILFATLSLTFTTHAQTGPTAQATFPWNATVYTEPPISPTFSDAKLGLYDRDITYCVADGFPLKLDIFYPTVRPTEPFPLIVFVIGGGLRDQSIVPNTPLITSNALAYTERGYAFAIIAYRGWPNVKLPTMIEDTKCAIRYFRARARSHNINPDRIGLFGGSSGGYLATMLGLTDASAGFEGTGGFDGVSSRVQAVIALNPQVSFELPPYSPEEAEGQREALPPNSSPQFRRAVSLPTYVTKNAPPFLFFHGEFDAGLSPGTSLELHAKLVSAGVDSTYVLVKRAGHGLGPRGLRLPNTPYGPEPTVAETKKMQVEFFDKHLKK